MCIFKAFSCIFIDFSCIFKLFSCIFKLFSCIFKLFRVFSRSFRVFSAIWVPPWTTCRCCGWRGVELRSWTGFLPCCNWGSCISLTTKSTTSTKVHDYIEESLITKHQKYLCHRNTQPSSDAPWVLLVFPLPFRRENVCPFAQGLLLVWFGLSHLTSVLCVVSFRCGSFNVGRANSTPVA